MHVRTTCIFQLEPKGNDDDEEEEEEEETGLFSEIKILDFRIPLLF
jgi:hypothetical protein